MAPTRDTIQGDAPARGLPTAEPCGAVDPCSAADLQTIAVRSVRSVAQEVGIALRRRDPRRHPALFFAGCMNNPERRLSLLARAPRALAN